MLALLAAATLAASAADANHAANFKPATYYQCLARSSEQVDVLDDGNMAERACLKGCDVQYQKNGTEKAADGSDVVKFRGHYTGTPCSVPMVIAAPAAPAAAAVPAPAVAPPVAAMPPPAAPAAAQPTAPSAAVAAAPAATVTSSSGASFDHVKNFTAATYYKCLAKSSDQINVRSDGIGDLHEMACIDGCDVAYQKLGPTTTADGKPGVMYRGHFPGTPCSVPLVVPGPAAAPAAVAAPAPAVPVVAPAASVSPSPAPMPDSPAAPAAESPAP